MKYCLSIVISFLILGMVSVIAYAEKDISLDVTLSDSSISRGDDDQEFEAGETFYIHLKLTNDGASNITPSDDIDVQVDLDDTKYYDETLHLTTNLEAGNNTYLVISSSNLKDEWNYNLLKYECKDDMEVEVRLSGGVESTGDTAKLTIEEKTADDILHITLDPEQPTLDGELKITVTNEDNDDVDNARVKITELESDGEWDKSDDDWADTTDDGEVKVTLSKKFGSGARGKFQVDAYKDGYCKDTTTFEITKKLVLTGPEPAKPQAGKSFAFKVTNEVGDALRFVTVVLSPGLYKGTTDSSGYAKFTLNTAGTYTAAAAATNYDDATPITLTVSEKPNLEVSITPTEPKIGDTVTITVTSGGSAVSGATVSITLPDGSEKTYTSSSNGKASYTIQVSGYHSVDAKKEDYNTGSGGFTVMNSLNVVIPDLSNKQEGDEISVTVKDGKGNPVSGASVSVLGTSISSTTDASGVFKFNMPKTGAYTLHVTKDGFTAKDVSLKSSGMLSLKLSSMRVEVGEKVKVTVYDESGVKVYGDIQITKPDGGRESVTKDEFDYVPQQAGTYNIIVSKENYASASETLTVGLKSIVFDLSIEGNTLKITASVGGNPVENITLTVTTPSGEEKEVMTDRDGVALLKAEKAGEYSVSTKDPNYESGRVTIIKKGLRSLLWWIILALLIILLLVMVIGVGVFHWHFRRKKGKYQREKDSALS